MKNEVLIFRFNFFINNYSKDDILQKMDESNGLINSLYDKPEDRNSELFSKNGLKYFYLRNFRKIRIENINVTNVEIVNYEEASGSLLMSFSLFVYASFQNYSQIREQVIRIVKDIDKIFSGIFGPQNVQIQTVEPSNRHVLV